MAKNNSGLNVTTREKILLIITILLLAYAVYLYKNNNDYKYKAKIVQEESEKLKNDVVMLNQKYADMVKQIEMNEKDKIVLLQGINQVGSQYNNLMQDYSTKINEVKTLQKVVYIDPELLKKYSKYYFLNENYTPSSTEIINPIYTLNNKELQIRTEVRPKLEAMMLAAKNENIPLVVHSAYRSFNEQKGLKTAYTQKYGIGANTFSADQGYSEHQLGTTVDITDGVTGMNTRFENTNSFKWLNDNAHKYGFIMSYPKGNSYYMYEPWHFRYVGVELATYLHNNNLKFYDLDQKVIDTYKVKIFE